MSTVWERLKSNWLSVGLTTICGAGLIASIFFVLLPAAVLFGALFVVFGGISARNVWQEDFKTVEVTSKPNRETQVVVEKTEVVVAEQTYQKFDVHSKFTLTDKLTKEKSDIFDMISEDNWSEDNKQSFRQAISTDLTFESKDCYNRSNFLKTVWNETLDLDETEYSSKNTALSIIREELQKVFIQGMLERIYFRAILPKELTESSLSIMDEFHEKKIALWTSPQDAWQQLHDEIEKYDLPAYNDLQGNPTQYTEKQTTRFAELKQRALAFCDQKIAELSVAPEQSDWKASMSDETVALLHQEEQKLIKDLDSKTVAVRSEHYTRVTTNFLKTFIEKLKTGHPETRFFRTVDGVEDECDENECEEEKEVQQHTPVSDQNLLPFLQHLHTVIAEKTTIDKEFLIEKFSAAIAKNNQFCIDKINSGVFPDAMKQGALQAIDEEIAAIQDKISRSPPGPQSDDTTSEPEFPPQEPQVELD